MRVVRLLVKESFRGVDVPEVEVLTGSGGGDCGFGFQIGHEYLVYADRRETDQQLVTGICTRTRSLGKAQEDLAYIHGLTKARAGSTILGEIRRHRRTEDGKFDRSPMPNIKVIVEGGDRNFEAVSDEKGKFTVGGMPAGNYKISLSLPKGLTTSGNEQGIELAEKGCAAVYFGVESIKLN